MPHGPGGFGGPHGGFGGPHGFGPGFGGPHFGGPMGFHPPPAVVIGGPMYGPRPYGYGYGYGYRRGYYDDDVICCCNIF